MPHPSTSSAYGIWSLNEVRDAVRGENWPSAGPPIGTQSVDFTSGAGLRVNATSTITMTGDWTIESWCKGNLTSTGYWFDFRLNGSYPAAYFTGGSLVFYNPALSGNTVALGVSSDVWFHIAAVHSSGVTKIYVDGVEKGSITDGTSYTNPSDLTLSQRYTTGSYFLGYQTNFRVSSSAIYTGNFTAPTEPLPVLASTEVLVCAADTFIDRSGNNHTVTTESSPVISTENPF